MSKPQRLPERNKFLEELKIQGKFAEVVLTAWGLTEVLMDDVLLKEYSLSGHDHRAGPILKLDFEDKLQLQKKASFVSKDEFKTVQRFQQRRNFLFHKDGLWFANIAVSEKEELAEIAIKAAQVMEALSSRASGPALKEVNWFNSR